MLLRVVNGFFAALFAVMVGVSFVFLVAARDGLGRGPESVWIAASWAGLFALLAILAFANMRRAGAEGPQGRLILLNAAAAAPLLAGLVALDPVWKALCGGAALPFALTALLLAVRRRSQD
jgi:hypothetical protein